MLEIRRILGTLPIDERPYREKRRESAQEKRHGRTVKVSRKKGTRPRISGVNMLLLRKEKGGEKGGGKEKKNRRS